MNELTQNSEGKTCVMKQTDPIKLGILAAEPKSTATDTLSSKNHINESESLPDASLTFNISNFCDKILLRVDHIMDQMMPVMQKFPLIHRRDLSNVRKTR